MKIELGVKVHRSVLRNEQVDNNQAGSGHVEIIHRHWVKEDPGTSSVARLIPPDQATKLSLLARRLSKTG